MNDIVKRTKLFKNKNLLKIILLISSVLVVVVYLKFEMKGINLKGEKVSTLLIYETRYDISNPFLWKYFNGVLEIYYKNKELKGRSFYKDGKLNGIRQYWFNNGSLEAEVPFVNGKVHGYRKHWNENGTLLAKIGYSNGELHGYSYFWYDTGVMRERRLYTKSKLIKKEELDHNGLIILEQIKEIK